MEQRRKEGGLLKYVLDYLEDPERFREEYKSAEEAMAAYGLTKPQQEALLSGDLAGVHAHLAAEVGEFPVPYIWHFGSS